ncbi:MAG: anti-sigma factor, partial [Alphaproteobacteria bacterium]
MIDRDGPFVGDMLLQDFVDGRLDPAMAERVKDLLANAPGLQQRAVEHMAVVHHIRQHFAEYDSAPLPPPLGELGRRLQGAIAPRRTQRLPRWVGMAAAASIAVAIGGVTWFGMGSGGGLPLATLVSFGSSSKMEAAPLTLAAAPPTSGVTAPASAPDFSGLGFKLLESRTIGRGDRDAVQLVYESENGARVSLYYSDAGDENASRVAVREEGALSMLFWQDGARAFSMIGEVDRETLLKLGRAVSGQSPFETVPG